MNNLTVRNVMKLMSVVGVVGMMIGCGSSLERTEQLISQGKYEEAKKLIEGSISTDYQNPDVHVAHGKVLLYLKNHPAALNAFKKAKSFAATAGEKIGAAYLDAGKKMYADKDLNNAKLYLAAAVRENPTLKETVLTWGEQEWLASMSDPEKEDFMYSILMQFWGKETLLEKLTSLEQKAIGSGDKDFEIRIAERIMENSESMETPQLVDYYRRISDYYLAKNDQDAADPWIQEASDNYSDQEPFIALIGHYYVKTGDLDKAMEMFEHGEELFSQSWAIQKGIADVLYLQSKFNKPQRIYTDILTKAPELADGRLYYNLAGIDASKGSTTQALERLTKAFELDPSLKTGAAEDANFKSLISNAKFKELVGITP